MCILCVVKKNNHPTLSNIRLTELPTSFVRNLTREKNIYYLYIYILYSHSMTFNFTIVIEYCNFYKQI